MIDIKQGDTVMVRSQGGRVTGEILRVNNRKVTVRGKERHIEENGQELTLYINEEFSVLGHNIVEVIET